MIKENMFVKDRLLIVKGPLTKLPLFGQFLSSWNTSIKKPG